MQYQLEAVGDFLARLGALEESNAIVEMMKAMGYEVSLQSKLRWRTLLATMKKELSLHPATVTTSAGSVSSRTLAPVDYVFLFERVLQLSLKLPNDLSRSFFSSRLMFHILVERFARAFRGLDHEIFKLESDTLCHTEGIFDLCLRLNARLFGHKRSFLYNFLMDFEQIFHHENPKEGWDRFYATHRLTEISFRRDMKRALNRMESEMLGPSEIEKKVTDPLVWRRHPRHIPKHYLLQRFPGSDEEWLQLCGVDWKHPEKEVDEEEQQQHQQEEVEKEQQEQEQAHADEEAEPMASRRERDQVWASRLPYDMGNSSGEADGASQATSEADDAPTTPPPAMVSTVRAKRSRATTLPTPTMSSPTQKKRKKSLAESPRPASPPPSRSPVRPVKTRDSPAPRSLQHAVASPVRQRAQASTVPAPAECSRSPPAPTSSSSRTVSRKGRQRVRWSKEEVEALEKGIRMFSESKNIWRQIKNAFPEQLHNRTNVDLKDKYRNLQKARRVLSIEPSSRAHEDEDDDTGDHHQEEIV